MMSVASHVAAVTPECAELAEMLSWGSPDVSVDDAALSKAGALLRIVQKGLTCKGERRGG